MILNDQAHVPSEDWAIFILESGLFMKPFTTHRTQLKGLRDRGLIINDGSKAMRILEAENYYNVINGYKDLFLQRDAKGNPVIPEQYNTRTKFEDIYELFTFDRELRMVLLKYLLIFENNIKSKIAYRFSEKFKQAHAYLQMQNYNKHADKLEKVLQLIAILSNELSRKSKRNGPIKHYLDQHDSVPLWVLVNYLTIGNMSNFYDCLDLKLQDTIAKDFSIPFKKSYGGNIQITPLTLVDVLKTANLFRNVCAHEERLYNFILQKQPRSKANSTLLSIPQQLLIGNCFTILAFMKLVLPKKEHQQMLKNLSKLFYQYRNNFSSISFDQVLKEMGFPANWEQYF